ncbi:anaerobic glycerol-3-phosphate dehydrogenase subunit C [Desulfitobacterium sp.]|uniref:anaerobic glycerol-3-phosphate dehydrogenase subunit C n=1 Tax=Desulfitobacterium sp. TaxID=49981 RepID=UPI002B1F0A5F|nr:anaerobic glycerol-3-phosphate dehydrogenase subunit C [Desulfitobacterium sp.]MEA4903043.1 anaerobic glycerol-3-phosphate dehydrogenase subunit C [Desulfitobacterium sp.]
MKLEEFQIDALNSCVKCSICVEYCPVVKVNPAFPGPKQLGLDWLRLSQSEQLQPDSAVNYCTNCKICEAVCPAGVLPASINQLTKYHFSKKRIALREFIFSNPLRLGKLVHIWPKGVNFFMKTGLVKAIMEKLVGISAKASMPTYSTKSFSDILKRYEQKLCAEKKIEEIVYFPGCFTEYNRPEVGISLVKIFNKLNYRVIVPEFMCCGQPAISNARLQDINKYSKHNVSIIKKYIKEGVPILFTCPSCLLTIKEEYRNLLDIKEAENYNPFIWDAAQFLLEHDNLTQDLYSLLNKEKKRSLKMAYHQPCHLKASGLGTPGLSLLNNVAGFKITPLEAGCCGLSGSYGLKIEKQWISHEIGKNLKNAIDDVNPEALVTECGMCSVQINHLVKLPVYHPLELLAQMI